MVAQTLAKIVLSTMLCLCTIDIENKSDSACTNLREHVLCDFDLGSDYENDLVVYDPESQTVYNTNAWNDSFERDGYWYCIAF